MTVVFVKARRRVRIQFHHQGAIRRTPLIFRSMKVAQQFAKAATQ